MKVLALVLGCCISLVPSVRARADSWQRPVEGPILRAFGLAADPYARGQHRGIDLGARPGEVVRAACRGRVRFAGSVPRGGRTVSIACGHLVATYQHLDVLLVRRGQTAPVGATIGTAGSSGRPRPHLHLGARDAASGRYVDPLTLLLGAPRAPGPLGRAPRGPVALGPAPRPVSPRAAPVPALRAQQPRGAPSVELPFVVWIGLALFGLGLPLGGVVRRRRREGAAVTARAQRRRWAAAHR